MVVNKDMQFFMEKKKSAPILIISADTVTDTEFWSHTNLIWDPL